MDLRLLEYFVAVAELEHVGQAAARLHISQSPLSRQIRQLEKDLQLELFIRERQRIRLTESGRWLLEQAKGLLARSGKIRLEAQHRSRGQAGTLSVAFTSAVMWSGFLPRLVKDFQDEFAGATIELVNMRSALQPSSIRSGRIDVGFVSTLSGVYDLEVTCVLEEPSLLVIPAADPLSRKRQITPRDLQGVRWVLLSETLSPNRQDRFFAACAKAGFTPKVVQMVSEPISLLALVEAGLGVGLIRNSARNYAPPTLVFKSLPWFQRHARTYMLRPLNGSQALAEHFIAKVPKADVSDFHLKPYP